MPCCDGAGQCVKNAVFMESNCRLSCGLCTAVVVSPSEALSETLRVVAKKHADAKRLAKEQAAIETLRRHLRFEFRLGWVRFGLVWVGWVRLGKVGLG